MCLCKMGVLQKCFSLICLDPRHFYATLVIPFSLLLETSFKTVSNTWGRVIFLFKMYKQLYKKTVSHQHGLHFKGVLWTL